MSMFKKSNLKETFTALYARKTELGEQMQWFDGSDGELEIIEENNFISAAFEVFHKQYGSSPVVYFGLDTDEDYHKQEMQECSVCTIA